MVTLRKQNKLKVSKERETTNDLLTGKEKQRIEILKIEIPKLYSFDRKLYKLKDRFTLMANTDNESTSEDYNTWHTPFQWTMHDSSKPKY